MSWRKKTSKRIVLTSTPISLHLVPLAQAFEHAGHEVAVATGAVMVDELDRSGVRHLPLRQALGPDGGELVSRHQGPASFAVPGADGVQIGVGCCDDQ
ncbi:hypothetical protein GCM10011579_034020 [Streptomyces albiflavescens]|uniref:Glycosyltransferase n=1 Tax=Streptomyces albiflavescens TaxID=1623582 RepID=A0A918D4T9_9ACTN|nr:hypothetical protein [Streptomyces albiflavescens]GGN64535.1 hypothetical protein GCM10011579_034020 [Streptomyces albiflavescens]